MARILVVEDDQLLLDNLLIVLTLEGFEVNGVMTGYEGLEYARSTLPDVVLCDILLPDIDGFTYPAVTRRLPYSVNSSYPDVGSL